MNSSLLINVSATKRNAVAKQETAPPQQDAAEASTSKIDNEVSINVEPLQEAADVTDMVYDEPLVSISHQSETHLVDPLSLDEETCNVASSGDAENQAEFSLASITINEESDSVDTDLDLSTDEVSCVDDKEGYTGSQLFKCAKCKNGYPSSMVFKTHLSKCVDMAEATKPFKCVHCGRIFKSSNSLVDHIKIHGTVKFGCSLCDFKHGHHLQVR